MIDQTRLDELRAEIGSEDLAEVIEMFCEEVEDALSKLDGTSFENTVERLHFLKGSALNIGLTSVSDLCREEELRLREDPTALPAIDKIKSVYARTKPGLIDSL